MSCTRPIRAAQVVGKMFGGGVGTVVMNYYRHIDRSRFQFDFIVDSDSEAVPVSEIESLGGRVFRVPPYQCQASYRREIEQLFRQEQWPIVHSHINALSVFPLAAAEHAGVPIRLAHSHSTAGKGEHIKNLAKFLLKTQANRYPTHKIACCKYSGEWLFGKNAEFDVLYNAIELDRFVFDPHIRNEVRNELELDENDFVLGNVARFATQKNQLFLIDSFARLAQQRDDVKLLLVGDGELSQRLHHSVKRHGISDRVIFLGQRDDVERIYQALDAFVLPSLYEGLALVAVEAQMAGLPCFLSNTITREANVTGEVTFLPIDNPEVWANALRDSAPRKNRAVDKSVFYDYDINHAAKRLSNIYEQLLAEAGIV